MHYQKTVNNKVTTKELRDQFPDLAMLLVEEFKKVNTAHETNSGKALLDISTMEAGEIVNSPEFEKFLRDPGYKGKEDIIKKYNTDNAPEAQPKQKVTVKQPKVDKKPAGTARERHLALKKLKWNAAEIKKMSPEEQQRLIEAGLTKSEHEAYIKSQQTPGVSKEQQAADVNKKIKDAIESAQTAEALEEAETFALNQATEFAELGLMDNEELESLMEKQNGVLKINLTFDTVQVGNILVLNTQRKNNKVRITKKTEDSITVEALETDEVTVIKKADMTDRVSQLYKEESEATPTLTKEDVEVSVESMENTLTVSAEELKKAKIEGETKSAEDLEKELDDLIC